MHGCQKTRLSSPILLKTCLDVAVQLVRDRRVRHNPRSHRAPEVAVGKVGGRSRYCASAEERRAERGAPPAELAVKSGVGHSQNVDFVEKLEERANELVGQEVDGAGCGETPPFVPRGQP